MFEVKVEINNEYELEELLWGQGLSTFKEISKVGLDDELYAYDLDYRDAYDAILDAINNDKEEYLWNYILDNFSEYNLHDLFSELDCIDLDDTIEE